MPPGLLGPIPKCAWPEGGPYGGRSPPPSWDRRRRPAPWAGGHRTRTARSRTGASSDTTPRPRAGPACRGCWSTPARRARCSPGSGAPRPAALPRLPVSGPPGRAHRSHDRAQQLVAQLPLAAVADQPGGHRGLDIPTRGLAIHPRPLTRRAQPLPAQPAAQLPESRSPPPPETPLDSSRSLDLNGSVAVAPRHHGVRHAGGPTTGNPGGPMKVARNGSDRSHDGGRRHDRGNSPTSVRQSPR
jgi:hypothetical protein